MNTCIRAVVIAVIAAVLLPYNGSLYAEPRRRNVSLKEANDLVFAYLKSTGCTNRTCWLERYHDVVGSDFYGFQGISNNPHSSFNLGYYEVDPRTGDVWSGVVCERFEIPSVVRLQRTIRKRIGLTDVEYRKLQRPGPLCDPGDKPTVVRTK